MSRAGVLHFNYLPQQADWILRLMSRLAANASPTTQALLRTWSHELGEVAGAIATRTRIVDIVTHRVRVGLEAISKELITDLANVETHMNIGAAYTLPDGLPFALVADLDSFLFETRSTYELMVKFIWILLRELGSPKSGAQVHHMHGVLEAEISARGGNTAWIDELRDNRHFFAHETAGWPALRIASLEPLKVDLVLLRRNVMLLDDPSTYVSLRKFQDIYVGFISAFGPIENWLSFEIDRFKPEDE
jgi:hypothetical protein